jgi:hypothetical protein
MVLTIENIKNAFEKSGIYSMDSSKTLAMIGSKAKLKKLFKIPLILIIYYSIQKVIRAYETNIEKVRETLFYIVECFIIQYEID